MVFNTSKKKKMIEDEFMDTMVGQDKQDFEMRYQNVLNGEQSYGDEIVTFKDKDQARLVDTNPQLYRKLRGGLLNRESRHTFMSDNGKYIYHLGIIDYLQDFNWEKLGEHKFKSL